MSSIEMRQNGISLGIACQMNSSREIERERAKEANGLNETESTRKIHFNNLSLIGYLL